MCHLHPPVGRGLRCGFGACSKFAAQRLNGHSRAPRGVAQKLLVAKLLNPCRYSEAGFSFFAAAFVVLKPEKGSLELLIRWDRVPRHLIPPGPRSAAGMEGNVQ